MLRLSRSRPGDPVNEVDKVGQKFGSLHEPSMSQDFVEMRVSVEEMKDWLPSYDERRAILARDGLASVEYATAVLGARAVVVLGHSHCGAVEEAKGQPGAKLEDAIAANARLTAQELESSPPFISKAVDKGQVKVVAGVYDLKNGHVDFFG